MTENKVVFTRAEVKNARKEMSQTGSHISSVSRDGVRIGLTQNNKGRKYVSAYVDGFWMGDLVEFQDGLFIYEDGCRWNDLLASVGTEFEKDGRQLIGLFSKYDMGNNDDYSALLGVALRAFERNLVDAGLLK